MSAPTIQYLGPPPTRVATTAPAVRLASMVILAAATQAIWWPTFGPRALWYLPPVGLGVAVAANRIPVRLVWRPWLVALCWLLWTPLVMVLTNQPISAAFPTGLGSGVAAFFDGPAGPGDATQFAAWLTVASGLWLMGADMTARPGRSSVAVAFFVLALPFAAAIPLLSHGGGAAWQGGAVLVAALLWATRGNLRGSLPALATVGVVAALVAAAVGPTDKWQSLDRARANVNGGAGHRSDKPQGSDGGSALNTSQTYGPIKDDFTGGTMLTIESDRPALWRMQVLDTFDGRGWVLGSDRDDDLPQPAAIGTKIGVRVDGLTDARVVSPGRVLGVSGAGPTTRTAGETVQLARTRPGDAYSVTAQYVQAKLDTIGTQSIPSGDGYARYTAVFPARQDIPTPVTSVADRLTPTFAQTEMGQTILLAKQLSDANTELGVVQNVERYLGSATFRYSLDVPAAGDDPILDFLTKTHVGYCQHFAGAAALLLRLAGVPTRVAVGFATGTQAAGGVYDVADKDAHAWIEVYFQGVGWVPFNPTPPSAAASIAPHVDVTHPGGSGSEVTQTSRPAGTVGDGNTIGLVLIALLSVGSIVLWRRARHGQPVPALGDVLVRLVPPPAGAATTHLEIRRELAKLGPSLDALGEEAERGRFGGTGQRAERHPHRRVWRALIRDVGLPRAIRLGLFGAPRPTLTGDAAAGSFQQVDEGPRTPAVAVSPERSVAPPR